MRISCNGCRVLRKGCGQDCSIRPCLEWIRTPESQANATVFLAKFYGRAGLTNLIDAGPHHLRPAIFKSLLSDACGRIVNPIFGSVGLIWSGNWQLCEDAVEAVLKGGPTTRMATEYALTRIGPSLNFGDIRHMNKEGKVSGLNQLRRVRTRCRFKRSASKSKRIRVWIDPVEDCTNEAGLNRSLSHDSSLNQQSEPVVERASGPGETLAVSPETSEPECGGADPNSNPDGEIELDLTLGF